MKSDLKKTISYTGVKFEGVMDENDNYKTLNERWKAMGEQYHEDVDLRVPEVIMRDMINELLKKLEDKFEEGLKLKGYTFKNRLELQNFVTHNCTCVETAESKTYFVRGEAFFIHYKQKKQQLQPIDFSDRKIELHIDFGYYSFL